MTVVAFDFDGTLSPSGMTTLLGQQKDVDGEMARLVDQGTSGEMEFGENLRQRVALLEGLPEQNVEDAFGRLRLRNGVPEMIGNLRRSGVHVAVVTGNFERGVEVVLEREGVAVDGITANRLVFENGALTGELEGPLVDGNKGAALEEIAALEGTDHTIAVGDSALDISMLRAAETAIGFDPDPVIERHCDLTVTSIERLQLYFEQHDIITD